MNENSKILDNAFSFNIEINNQLNEICAPLEKHLDITLIAYRRFYINSGKLLYLFHHKDWMDYSFKNECWNSSSFYERVKKMGHENTLYYLWPKKPPSTDKVYCKLYDYDIWNGLIIYKKLPDCLETYAFASIKKNDVKVNNVYLFEKEVLEKFILYFKDKIFPLIIPNQNQILMPYQPAVFHSYVMEEQTRFFLDEIDIQNFYLRANGTDIKLTKRQEDCLFWFIQHRKMKEIGKMLDISEKTVEAYLRNIMLKTHCNTKAQLMNLYKNNRNL